MNRTSTALAFALLPLLVAAQIINPASPRATSDGPTALAEWAATVRPPLVYTDKIKRDLLADFGGDPNGYELDHIFPLAAGGHPTHSPN